MPSDILYLVLICAATIFGFWITLWLISLVINDSSDEVWYYRDRKQPKLIWSFDDRLGADYIPAHSSYLVISHD